MTSRSFFLNSNVQDYLKNHQSSGHGNSQMEGSEAQAVTPDNHASTSENSQIPGANRTSEFKINNEILIHKSYDHKVNNTNQNILREKKEKENMKFVDKEIIIDHEKTLIKYSNNERTPVSNLQKYSRQTNHDHDIGN